MNLELSRGAVAGVVAFFAVSLGLLALILGRLGALPLPGSATHMVRIELANAEGLPVQADVLVHGVKVGVVSSIEAEPRDTRVTLALDAGAPTLRADASARIGFKTPLGEQFVDLDPGRAASGLTGPLHSRSTVEIDDALAWLDRGGRMDLRSALSALAQGASPPAEISGAISGLSSVTASLHRLTAELRAQRSDIRGIIGDGGLVLGVLASRPTALRTLVLDAQQTLSAFGAQRRALGEVLEQLSGLLSTGEATLRDVRPLITTATPIVGELAAAAPAMTAALQAVPTTVAALNHVLATAPAIRSSVIPALRSAQALAPDALRALTVISPAMADVVPVAQYLGPRGRTVAAWFANTADLGSHGDAKGDWARFFVMFDPSTLFGVRAGSPSGNSYTAPGDAARNQPYRSGDYPRLMPFSPALGR